MSPKTDHLIQARSIATSGSAQTFDQYATSNVCAHPQVAMLRV